MKSAQAILHFFSKILEHMVDIMAWNPSICFCCCCSCWPINFIIASFFAASCCNSDNHGQKSWDKFTFAALSQTRQTNSQARIHLHLVSPSPQPPTYNVGHVVHVISPEFQHCMGGGEGGGDNEI